MRERERERHQERDCRDREHFGHWVRRVSARPGGAAGSGFSILSLTLTRFLVRFSLSFCILYGRTRAPHPKCTAPSQAQEQ